MNRAPRRGWGMNVAIGILLGIMVGLLSGAAFLVLLQAANGAKIASVAAIVTILVQVAIVPTLWLGAPLLVAAIPRLGSFAQMKGPYLVALACSFAIIVILPLLAWIRGAAGSWVLSAPEGAKG
jgi:hypothetical protein